jgi:hypothetical protein
MTRRSGYDSRPPLRVSGEGVPDGDQAQEEQAGRHGTLAVAATLPVATRAMLGQGFLHLVPRDEAA